MDEPTIQPPKQRAFPWPWIVAGVAAIMLMGAVFYWKHEIADLTRAHVPSVIARPSNDNTEAKIAELKSLITTYRKMSVELAGKTGQARSDALDDRTLVVGRINALIDVIPAARLPAEAHRFTAGR